METLITWLVVSLAGLIVSARVTVRLPVLGPTPVLGLVALALVLTAAAAVLWIVRVIARDGLRLRPRMVTP